MTHDEHHSEILIVQVCAFVTWMTTGNGDEIARTRLWEDIFRGNVVIGNRSCIATMNAFTKSYFCSFPHSLIAD